MAVKFGAVILAAGESRRLGEPKQLLPYRGTTLLAHALATAQSIHPAALVVVLGAHAGRIAAALERTPVRLVENREWHLGMATSLRAGLQTLLEMEPGVEAAIFLVCDQPLVSPAVLEQLLSAHRAGAALAAAAYGGALGVPALFGRALFAELLALTGDAGARTVLHAHRLEAAAVPFPEGAADIDTPADYARLARD